ncbi:hypothetical protein AcW1_006143 [Taiwanofungus camphoratus]|nr:hypothetical protein AcW1_006143 [Antrodia cinnamomea]
MASPHPSFSSPGPSYYHTPSPYPQFPYNSGPGPAPYYQYQMPPINGPMSMHQPASPKLNGPSRGRFNPHRGGVPSHHHYETMASPAHNVRSPTAMQSPPVSPVSPYTHSQKYPQHISQIPYSPPCPPQSNGLYPQVWTGQPLSPLPKQLAMLPPPPISQLPPPSQSQIHAQSQIAPTSPNFQQDVSPTLSSHPLSHQPPSHTQGEGMTMVQSPSLRSSRSGSVGWVIWSRRPQDPSRAHGVIISPRAYPPDDVIQKALDLPTPPVSPKLRSLELPLQRIVPLVNGFDASGEPDGSPEVLGDPSSSATETTPASSTPADTPMPGSPVSSNTSVSIPAVSPSSGNVSKALTSLIGTPEANNPPLEPVTAENVSSATTDPAPGPATSEAAPAVSPQMSTPTSKPAPAKKSWASLLHSSDASASSSKPRLPVSSVIGFSIPATSASNSQTLLDVPAVPPHRNDLLNLLNSGPTTSNIPLRITPRGLVNTGNMCFANAVLQILVYCPPFHRLFLELNKYLAGPVVGSQKEGTKATPLIDAIMQFVKEFVPESFSDSHSATKAKGKEREDDFYEAQSFIPTHVYDVMKEKKRFANMIGGHQEDAEEFLGFFLDTLEEELLSLANSLSFPSSKASVPVEDHEEETPKDSGWLEVGKRNRAVVTRTIKSTESPITRIFGGKFRSTLRAPHQRDSVVVEEWRSLRLDIQRETVHTISDALQQISHPQPVQISQPTRPGVVVEASQQALIESLPPILVLHLKRFLYDISVGDVIKIGKQIAYGPELEISSDLIAPTRRTSHPVKYQLFGVLYHHGQSASGGHYTLDVLHPNRDLSNRPRAAWIRIDDELVSDIRVDDVFGVSDRDDRCAYLLFYRRISSWGPARTW